MACCPYLGEVAARHHRAFFEPFAVTSAGLGFDPIVTRLQWSALAKVTAVAGLGPGQVTQAVIDEGRQALTDAIGPHRPASHGPKALGAVEFLARTGLRKDDMLRPACGWLSWTSGPPYSTREDLPSTGAP